MTDAPTPNAEPSTPGTPPGDAAGWVTVSITVPAGRVAEFYKQAAQWLGADAGPGQFEDEGHTRTS